MKIGVRYLLEKSTKPFASREIAKVLFFLEIAHFCSFFASFSDSLVTVERLNRWRT